MRFLLTWYLCFLVWLPQTRGEPASVASISPDDLVEFESQPGKVQDLIRYALSLTARDLTYRFGSNSPSKGGMDCSGTVQHTLVAAGFQNTPRSSYAIYQWAEKHGEIVQTKDVQSIEDSRFSTLKPGDLLFWTGTYQTSGRNPAISHVMIFLGHLKKDGKGVVFGASDGRRFRGQRIRGVSVFDWRLPSKTSSSRFFGFSRIPGMNTDSGE